MQPERQASEQEGHRGRVAWSLLAIFLILLPLVAVGRIMVATDDELAEVRAQAIAEMEIESRNVVVTYATSFGWNQNNGGDTGYSLTYDCAVLRLNTRIAIRNLQVSGLYALNYYGFWTADGHSPTANSGTNNNVAGSWDIYIGKMVLGDIGTPFGSTAGGEFLLNGLRIELAYDDIDSAARRFLFLRMGSDDVHGRMTVNEAGTTGTGTTCYFSLDALLDNPLESTLGEDHMRLNYHRQTLAMRIPMSTAVGRAGLRQVNFMDFGLGTGSPYSSSACRTDFYLSIADTITARNGASIITNAGRALGPWNRGRETIPGRGMWMHFQRGFVDAAIDICFADIGSW